MNGPFFIETLARNGDVLHRHRVDALPIRIGRGYDNDFIVDDDYTAPRHAVVELDGDGQLVLRDLGTRNGVVHKGRRQERIVLAGDTVVRVGHTQLRVRAAGFAVPPELADRTMHGWEGALPGLAGIVLVGAVSLFTRWLSDTQEFQFVRYLQALAIGLGAALAWAGMWGFANRLFGRHARLGRHLFIVGCALVALAAYQMAASALGYAFSLESFTRYASHVGIALLAGMVWFHLCTIRPRSRRLHAFTCVALAALGSGLTLIGHVQRSGRLADELYMSVLLPPSMRASPDHGVDEFMAQVGAMQKRLDSERTRKDKAGETDG
jgi:pSer/pThr/pTyr-binding forkhead associated (FHA) protein